jgi:hypothetical protein
MTQSIGLVALVVRNYGDALRFYIGKPGFTVGEDQMLRIAGFAATQ